jgi:hypothetical protein
MKAILQKAYLGGLIGQIKLGKKGEFEITDSGKVVMVLYGGGDKELFKEEIGIFTLATLVDMLKMMDEPTLGYKDGILKIKEKDKSFEYMTADPGVIFLSYKPTKDEPHILDKLSKAGKAVKVKVTKDVIQAILQGATILKDATVVTMEASGSSNTIINIGGENEHKFKVKLADTPELKDTVTLPKKEFQAILSECTGDEIEMEIRPGKAPVVIKEADVKYILNQVE